MISPIEVIKYKIINIKYYIYSYLLILNTYEKCGKQNQIIEFYIDLCHVLNDNLIIKNELLVVFLNIKGYEICVELIKSFWWEL